MREFVFTVSLFSFLERNKSMKKYAEAHGVEPMGTIYKAESGDLQPKGQLVLKSDYSDLYTWANDHGLMLTKDDWESSEHNQKNFYGDVSETRFRVPKLFTSSENCGYYIKHTWGLLESEYLKKASAYTCPQVVDNGNIIHGPIQSLVNILKHPYMDSSDDWNVTNNNDPSCLQFINGKLKFVDAPHGETYVKSKVLLEPGVKYFVRIDVENYTKGKVYYKTSSDDVHYLYNGINSFISQVSGSVPRAMSIDVFTETDDTFTSADITFAMVLPIDDMMMKMIESINRACGFGQDSMEFSPIRDLNSKHICTGPHHIDHIVTANTPVDVNGILFVVGKAQGQDFYIQKYYVWDNTVYRRTCDRGIWSEWVLESTQIGWQELVPGKAYRRPDGLIEQFGTYTDLPAGQSIDIDLPVEFPNGGLYVNANQNTDNTNLAVPLVRFNSRSTIRIENDWSVAAGQRPISGQWYAIGR